MSLKKYEAFVKCVDLGSLTKAAEAMECTQSAVSHMIQSLEEEFGFTLLRRSRGGARPTADGELVLPAIRGILNYNEQLSQLVASVRGVDKGTVRIGTFSSVAVHWLPGVIKEFQADYPQVEIRLMNGDYHDVEQWLAEGSADLGFVALPTEPEFQVWPLAEDRLLAVLPKEHRLAGLSRFPLAEAEKESFISLLENSDGDARRALDAVKMRPKARFTTKDDYAMIAMVEQGLGIAIMPELLLAGRTEKVRVMELDPPASRTIALAFPAAPPAPATRRFAEYVQNWVNRTKTGEVEAL